MEISSQQIKPYPRYMYHREHGEPKVVISKAEESELSTKGWMTTYVHKEYPKWVGDKIVNSQEEEERLLVSQQPKQVDVAPIDVAPVDVAPIDISAEIVPPDDPFTESEEPSVVKEIQVDGQDTAKIVEKPKKSPGRPKKKME